MSVKPIIHGRDHRPGGADPIPGTGEVPWAYITRDATPVTVPGTDAQTWLSCQDGGPGGFFTNRPDIYENAFHTISAVNYYGIKIKDGGTFEFWLDGVFPALVATKRGELGFDFFDGPGGAVGPAESTLQAGRRTVTATDTWDQGADNHVFKFSLLAIQGDRDSLDGPEGGTSGTPAVGNSNTPLTCLIFAKQNGGGGNNVSVTASLYVKRVSTGAFYPGSWL